MIMKEEALEPGRRNRRPPQASGEANEVELVVERLRETKQRKLGESSG